MSYPPPLPVSPLEYDHRIGEARPGIITAVGVMSIIVACISGLVSVSGIFSAMVVSRMARMTFPMPTVTTLPSVTVPAGTVTVGGIEATAEASADSMAEPERQIVIDTLARLSGMDDQRQKHLDLLLLVSGQKVFPFADRITPQLIQNNITERGTLRSSPGGAAGANFFLVGTGRLEVYDDHAVFRPDGSSDAVSASAASDDASGSSQSVTVSGGSTTSTIITRRGPTVVAPPVGPPIVFNVSRSATIVSLLTAAAGLALAIFLLVSGIMVLRNSRRGAKLHWIYVAIKIPLVIIASVAGWYLWSSFGSSIMAVATPPGGGPRPPSMASFMAISTIVSTVLALAYPVALIFVLISRTARQYYGAVQHV